LTIEIRVEFFRTHFRIDILALSAGFIMHCYPRRLRKINIALEKKKVRFSESEIRMLKLR